MEVTVKTYEQDKQKFFEAHNYDYSLSTSGMDEYDTYHKTYCFEDGATWYETSRPVIETLTSKAHGFEIKTNVKFMVTEYWNSKESGTKSYYEKW
ncbi:MAG: hypothetical protein J6S81_02205 [Treponema sp.]|nr:hypothetical protein [Treponema sp.]